MKIPRLLGASVVAMLTVAWVAVDALKTAV
jgi:hypothetical protein